jgi:protein-tyrosine phosphatase
VNRRPQAFRDIFETIADTDGCILFHCFAGKDRTGIIAAMLLALAGVSDDEIAADYAETDVQLAKQYEIWIDEAPLERREAFRAELRCPPERILGVLEAMRRRWGGVEGYLESAGTTAATIDSLRSKLA